MSEKTTAEKYDVTPAALRALCVLRDHPGISATQFAPLAWPHLRPGGGKMKPVLLAAQYLRRLKNKGYVRIRYSANPLKAPAYCIYYLSPYGFEIVEFHRIRKNCPPSYNDGKG